MKVKIEPEPTHPGIPISFFSIELDTESREESVVEVWQKPDLPIEVCLLDHLTVDLEDCPLEECPSCGDKLIRFADRCYHRRTGWKLLTPTANTSKYMTIRDKDEKKEQVIHLVVITMNTIYKKVYDVSIHWPSYVLTYNRQTMKEEKVNLG